MSQPEKVFRIGPCSASVFVNRPATSDSGEPRSFRSVNIQRSYRDEQGAWQRTSSFTLAHLPAAIEVMRRALDHVADQEATADGEPDT